MRALAIDFARRLVSSHRSDGICARSRLILAHSRSALGLPFPFLLELVILSAFELTWDPSVSLQRRNGC